MADMVDILNRLQAIEANVFDAAVITDLMSKVDSLLVQAPNETVQTVDTSRDPVVEIDGPGVTQSGGYVHIAPQDEQWFNRFKPTWTDATGTVEIHSGSWVTKTTEATPVFYRVDDDGFSKVGAKDKASDTGWSVNLTEASPYIIATLDVNSEGIPEGPLAMAAAAKPPSDQEWLTKRIIATAIFTGGSIDKLVRNQVGDIVDIGAGEGTELEDGDSTNRLLMWDVTAGAWKKATIRNDTATLTSGQQSKYTLSFDEDGQTLVLTETGECLGVN